MASYNRFHGSMISKSFFCFDILFLFIIIKLSVPFEILSYSNFSAKTPQNHFTFLFRHRSPQGSKFSTFPTGPNKPGDVDPKLLCPVLDVFCCWLPSSIRDRLRCGIDYSKVRLML